MFNFFKKDKPINIDKEAERHLIIAMGAHVQACEGEELGTVASRHVRRVAYRHALISSRLDVLLDAAGVPDKEES